MSLLRHTGTYCACTHVEIPVSKITGAAASVFPLDLVHRLGSANPRGVKNLAFGGPASDKKYQKLRVMNSLKICPP